MFNSKPVSRLVFELVVRSVFKLFFVLYSELFLESHNFSALIFEFFLIFLGVGKHLSNVLTKSGIFQV